MINEAELCRQFKNFGNDTPTEDSNQCQALNSSKIQINQKLQAASVRQCMQIFNSHKMPKHSDCVLFYNFLQVFFALWLIFVL